MTATMTVPADAAVPYLDAVRAALETAPAAEREELLEDLAEHLAELAAEESTPLSERLGPPAAYATEFVASAGVTLAPPAPPPPRESWTQRARRWLATPSARSVRAFLPELRPGWWVLRAYVLVGAVAAAGAGNSVVPVPEVFGSYLVGLLALAGAVVASVRLGRSARGGWDRAVTVGAVVAAVVVLAHMDRTEYVYVDGGFYGESPGWLVTPDGRVVTNIWPFDGAGQPLEGVFLFDQDGVPIHLGDVYQPDGSVSIPGLFPQDQYIDPDTGEETVEPPGPQAVSIPALPSTSTTSPPGTTTTATTPPETTTTAPPG